MRIHIMLGRRDWNPSKSTSMFSYAQKTEVVTAQQQFCSRCSSCTGNSTTGQQGAEVKHFQWNPGAAHCQQSCASVSQALLRLLDWTEKHIVLLLTEHPWKNTALACKLCSMSCWTQTDRTLNRSESWLNKVYIPHGTHNVAVLF